MKDYLISIAVFLVVALISPLLITIIVNNMNNQKSDYSVCMATPEYKSKIEVITKDDFSFEITDNELNKTEEIKGFDLICSIVAGEMPCSYSEEALKAQAVSALSYCLYKINVDNHPSIVKGIDVAFLSKEDAKNNWGVNYNENWSKIEKCVADVYPYVMFYQDEIVDAYFFSTSSGKTETAEDVFKVSKPYLLSVSCESDKSEKGYKTLEVISLDSFKKKISSINKSADFSKGPNNYIENVVRSAAGGIKSLTVCSTDMTGLEFRELFNLRSTNFTYSFDNNNFTFTVLGYGHGVGMSQTEANHLAISGYNWQEILEYFYHDVTFKKYLIDSFDIE